MKIDSIKNGIVLDHITAGKSLEVYKALGLDKLDCSVAIIKNVKSNKMGKKDILKIDEEFKREAKCESFKVYFGKYTELTKMLKNEMLLHQAYIPKTVFEESTTFVVQMQDDFDYWFDMAKCLFAGEYGKIDYEKGEKTVEMLLVKLAKMEVSIKNRLKELCDFS